MKKKVVTSGNKPMGSKQRYAVFNHNNRLIRKGMFTTREIQQYLNQRAQEGISYYAIDLKGLSRKLTSSEIKPIEIKLKKDKDTLLTKDLADLRALLKVLKTKPAWEGMIKAYHFDTALREEIPLSLWKKMGGDTL